MQHQKKKKLRQLRKWRIRKKIGGTAARPRMSVCFSNEHIYVQFIDDVGGLTLASASTRHKSTPGRDALAANVESAKKVGTLAAEAAKAKGISAIVFDRNGALYHGKVKALADAAREAGLQF
jgi:large subunit ribosomal protein L18